jgi:hypothetical protein
MTSSAQSDKAFRQLPVNSLVQPEQHCEGDEADKDQVEPENIHLQVLFKINLTKDNILPTVTNAWLFLQFAQTSLNLGWATSDCQL